MTVIDWRPGLVDARRWTVVAVVVTVLGVPFFGLPAAIRHGSGSIRIDLVEVLAVIGITAALAIVHEAVHGAVMLTLGARPTFGAVLVGRVVPALYTTSEGHLFTRLQYVAVAAAPALLISAAGLWATFAPWGGLLVIPLAVHLGGCVGDGAAVLQLARQPAGTLCEDLRDGVRFHRVVGA